MISLSSFLIVEDELLIAETIADILRNEGVRDVKLATTVEEAITHIEASPIDLVLTDIALGTEKNGIDLGELLNTNYGIPFIYVTSHADKAMLDKAKNSRPNAYIVKPFKREDILAAVELALFNAKHSASVSAQPELIVKEGRAIMKLRHHNILWIEADGNYSTIHLTGDKRHVVRQSLSEFQEQLPCPGFIRIHKSYLVNSEHITRINASSVLILETELPVGRSHQQNLFDIFRK